MSGRGRGSVRVCQESLSGKGMFELRPQGCAGGGGKRHEYLWGETVRAKALSQECALGWRNGR